MSKRPKHFTCVRWMTAALAATFATLGLLLYWLIRPYDAVRFVGEPGVATPVVVQAGDTVTITRESFCNDGVDVSVRRWADLLDDEGRVVGSFDLGALEFYTDGEARCHSPSVSGVTLPNYVIGPNGGPGTFSLRFEVSYRANPVRIVTISSSTTPFRVVPRDN